MIPIAVLWFVAGLIKRLNTLHDAALTDIKMRIEAIDSKFDARWAEHMKWHMDRGER